MKKLLAAVMACAVALACPFSLAACRVEEYSSLVRYYNKFDTTARLVVTANFANEANMRRLSELGAAVESFLGELESSLSSSVEGSCISRFNAAEAGAEVEIDELTYTVLSQAVEMYEFSDGCYNPAVYYSVDLFGFSPRFNELTWQAPLTSRRPYDRLTENGGAVTALAAPDEEYVNIFKELASHMSELEVYQREGRYYAAKPAFTVTGPQGDEYSLALDLGGIGKGYAADVVTSMMAEYGFEYGFFDFGSSSVSALASHESQSGEWELNLTDPDDPYGGAYARVYISSSALSSSGDYEKCYTLDGVTYCHIINPFTGRPIEYGIAACTVVGGSAARADALTTALSVMGADSAVEFVNGHLRDYKVVMAVRGEDGPCRSVLTNVPDLEFNPKYVLAGSSDGAGGIVLV